MAPQTIVMFLLCPGDEESVTVMVAVPPAPTAAAVGVPEITPVEELIAIPVGSPVAPKVYGVLPPETPPETLMGVMVVPALEAGMSYAGLSAKARDTDAVTVKFTFTEALTLSLLVDLTEMVSLYVPAVRPGFGWTEKTAIAPAARDVVERFPII